MLKILSCSIFTLFLSAILSCSQIPPFPSHPTPTPQPVTPISSPINIDLSMESLPTATPSPEPLEYVAEDLEGTVLLKSDSASQPETLEEDETLVEGDEIITQADSQTTLTLDENTMVHLGPNSDIKISQLKRNDSKGFLSHLLLQGGKILSEVEKLSESHSSFEVESNGVVCGVRGTAFEVLTEGHNVQTSTFHGIVAMKKGTQVQLVEMNQHGTFSLKKNGFLTRRVLNASEHSHYQSWLNQKTTALRKFHQRQELLNSINTLPPSEKSEILQAASRGKGRDRIKIMQHLVENKTEGSHAKANKDLHLGNPNQIQNHSEKIKGREENNHPAGKQIKKPFLHSPYTIKKSRPYQNSTHLNNHQPQKRNYPKPIHRTNSNYHQPAHKKPQSMKPYYSGGHQQKPRISRPIQKRTNTNMNQGKKKKKKSDDNQ